MRKVVCDGCEEDCGPRVFQLNMALYHYTNRGDVVGVDEYRTIELCGPHGEQVIELMKSFGIDVSRFIQQHHTFEDQEDTSAPSMAAARPLEIRLADARVR